MAYSAGSRADVHGSHWYRYVGAEPSYMIIDSINGQSNEHVQSTKSVHCFGEPAHLADGATIRSKGLGFGFHLWRR